ncbi:MAG: hypothetical protein ACR2KK_08925 [Acidimicrobiales bacterium]
MTADEEREIAVWMAFDRLDHAYLIHDDEAVEREFLLIERLREDAAGAASQARSPSLLDRARATLTSGIEHMVQLTVTPAIVLSGRSTEAAQGDAVLDEAARRVLGDVDVSVTLNGVELGVEVIGVGPTMERRLHLLVESGDQVTGVPLTPVFTGAGVVSATVPWSAELPGRVVIAVVSADDSGTAPPEA